MNSREIFVLIARLILGGLFTYAGVAKWLDPLSFSSSLAGLGFLPASVITPLAMGLPVVEIAFGICVLVVPAFRRAGALGLATLLMTFIALIGWTLLEGRVLKCSCFGGNSFLEFGGARVALVRNVIMLAIALYVCRHAGGKTGNREYGIEWK